MQLLVHAANAVGLRKTNNNKNKNKEESVSNFCSWPPPPSADGERRRSPLVAGDVQVRVDGQEGLLEEGDAAALLVL